MVAKWAFFRRATSDKVLPTSDQNKSASMTEKVKKYSVIFFLLLCALLIIKDAWLSDDAYITLRTVDNFLHGYGLTWNTDERVQAYTHPLWMFLLSATSLFIRNLYFASLLLSMVLSILAIGLFAFRLARTPLMAVLGLTMLAASKTFADYSTSGLEDPLTYLLIALFALVYFGYQDHKHSVLWLTFIAGLATLNRLDTLLLLLPALLPVLYKLPLLKSIRLILAGFAPFILWEAFSLFYYGFLFPNTAYAKLDTSVPQSDLLIQGITYIISSFFFDPILLLGLIAGVIASFVAKDRRLFPLGSGIFCYLLYIIFIGGDFMAGRFLAAPLFLAVIIFARIPLLSVKASWVLGMGAIVLLGIFIPHSRWVSNYSDKGTINLAGIDDERAFYADETGIWSISFDQTIPNSPWAYQGLQAKLSGQHVLVTGNDGFLGVMAGPNVHIVDVYGISDSLLARLPAEQPGWRIGHFIRDLPTGYLATVNSGVNVIEDNNLALYYSKLQIITRGGLFDLNRLKEIWKMNTGSYDYLLQRYNHDHPPKTPICPLALLACPGHPQVIPDNLMPSSFWERRANLGGAGASLPGPVSAALCAHGRPECALLGTHPHKVCR